MRKALVPSLLIALVALAGPASAVESDLVLSSAEEEILEVYDETGLGEAHLLTEAQAGVYAACVAAVGTTVVGVLACAAAVAPLYNECRQLNKSWKRIICYSWA